MVLDTLNSGRKALLVERNPNEAIQLLLPLQEQAPQFDFASNRALMELLGLSCEESRQYERACEYFLSLQDYYQAGYCQMLNGNINKATELWTRLLTSRSNHWCLTLYGMVVGNLNAIPTFLQIRNHIEADIIHLVWAGQMTMLENVLRYVDFLAEINYESYKFAGRALFHAGMKQEAGTYLLKGQKLLPNDPEVYYHLGQYYHALEQYSEAEIMLHQCLFISPTYLPAQELRARIKDKQQTA